MSSYIGLVVDDEPAIRWFIKVILERERVQTLEAVDAAQALRIVQKLGGCLDFIISDIIMPGNMDGVDLVHSVRNLFPHVPVILMSGYAERPGHSAFAFVPKPFTPEAILSAVKGALESGKPKGRTATG